MLALGLQSERTGSGLIEAIVMGDPKISETRVLWNTYPVHCCCMKLCETQLIAEEDYKFARTHTFALLTMVIAYCVQSSIYE